MSVYTLLSSTKPKARKQYNCIWCMEHILPGEVHVHENSVWDGNFQDHRFHIECDIAADKYNELEGGYYEFAPGDFKRGTYQHTDE